MAHELKRYCLAFILKNFDQAGPFSFSEGLGFRVDRLRASSNKIEEAVYRVFVGRVLHLGIGTFKVLSRLGVA